MSQKQKWEQKLLQQQLLNMIDKVLEKFALKKALQIKTWTVWSIKNCRRPRTEQRRDPVTAEGLSIELSKMIKIVQANHKHNSWFSEDHQKLNLQKNKNEMCECHGRIAGQYPIYIPKISILTGKMV